MKEISKYNYSKLNHCTYCSNLISNKARRCNSCSRKFRYRLKLNTIGYKDGQTLKSHFCIDCNNKISYSNWKWGKRRCRSCARKDKNNPNWKGGSSFEPYPIEWTEILKESIRIRDNHKCQICGKLEIRLCSYFKKLSIHHIDYDKENLEPYNLISLCTSCHMKTNYNREIYIEYFRILINILKNKKEG